MLGQGHSTYTSRAFLPSIDHIAHPCSGLPPSDSIAWRDHVAATPSLWPFPPSEQLGGATSHPPGSEMFLRPRGRCEQSHLYLQRRQTLLISANQLTNALRHSRRPACDASSTSLERLPSPQFAAKRGPSHTSFDASVWATNDLPGGCLPPATLHRAS